MGGEDDHLPHHLAAGALDTDDEQAPTGRSPVPVADEILTPGHGHGDLRRGPRRNGRADRAGDAPCQRVLGRRVVRARAEAGAEHVVPEAARAGVGVGRGHENRVEPEVAEPGLDLAAQRRRDEQDVHRRNRDRESGLAEDDGPGHGLVLHPLARVAEARIAADRDARGGGKGDGGGAGRERARPAGSPRHARRFRFP